MKVLVVSPHYDDGPLSLGQSMHDGELSKHRVTVGVLFSKSNWTQWFHPTRQRVPLASAIRFCEERWNAYRFGYRVRLGHLPEAPVRSGDISTESFLNAAFDAPTSPDLAMVAGRIEQWAKDFDVVLSPLGIGDHIDHQLAAEACGRLMESGAAVGFYEDRPYAVILDDDALAAAAKAIDERLVRRPVSGPMGPGKHKRIFYPSQFDQYFLGAIAADEEHQRREHVWVLPDSPWPAPA